jgi:hypothetical protein
MIITGEMLEESRYVRCGTPPICGIATVASDDQKNGYKSFFI